MPWYRITEEHWPETKRALGRFVARGCGFNSWAELQAADPTARRPLPIYVNPQNGTRFVHVTHKVLRWVNGETVIGGDRLRLGTRVDDDQLPQWVRTKLAQNSEDD